MAKEIFTDQVVEFVIQKNDKTVNALHAAIKTGMPDITELEMEKLVSNLFSYYRRASSKVKGVSAGTKRLMAQNMVDIQRSLPIDRAVGLGILIGITRSLHTGEELVYDTLPKTELRHEVLFMYSQIMYWLVNTMVEWPLFPQATPKTVTNVARTWLADNQRTDEYLRRSLIMQKMSAQPSLSPVGVQYVIDRTPVMTAAVNYTLALVLQEGDLTQKKNDYISALDKYTTRNST